MARKMSDSRHRPTSKAKPKRRPQAAAESRAAGPNTVVQQVKAAIAEAERYGMTRAEIAAAAKMPRSMIYKVADGETIPRLDTAERILNVVGMCLQVVPN